jgi:hypothetical protein
VIAPGAEQAAATPMGWPEQVVLTAIGAALVAIAVFYGVLRLYT